MHKRQVLVDTSGGQKIINPVIMKKLRKQIQDGLMISGIGYDRIIPKTDYFLIDTSDELDAAETIARYPGIISTAVVESTSTEFDKVVDLVFRIGRKVIYPGETFMVAVSQSGRLEYEPRDVEIAASANLIGELAHLGARIDEVKPSKTIYVKIDKIASYVSYFRYDGPGGLPVGSKGNAICLLEGDVRSSISSWLSARAGILPHFLIFDLRPFEPYDHLRTALAQALRLREMIPVRRVGLSLVKLGAALEGLRNACPVTILPIIAKRMLVRMACQYAKRLDLSMIVGGESLFKDSFLFLDDLIDTAKSFEKRLLLPVVALTDYEVDEYAKSLGLEGKDSYFMQETTSGFGEVPLGQVRDIESALEIEGLIEKALSNAYRRYLDIKGVKIHLILNDIS